jgi:hypothetical protein
MFLQASPHILDAPEVFPLVPHHLLVQLLHLFRELPGVPLRVGLVHGRQCIQELRVAHLGSGGSGSGVGLSQVPLIFLGMTRHPMDSMREHTATVVTGG